MKHTLSTSLIALILVLVTSAFTYGQCAMCRATMETNVSHGDIGIAAGMNTGILYLFAMPYIIVGVVGYLWYRKSKLNDQMASDYPG